MSRDPRIDAYIAKAQPFARPILEHVRERVHAVAPEVEETTKWSAPAFTIDGKILLIMAAFKQHAALNFWRGQELRGEAAELGRDGPVRQAQVGRRPAAGRGARPADPRGGGAGQERAAPRKVKHEPKPAPTLHPDFAKALNAAPKAKAVLDGFPPSAQREYFDWISEAKQDATRSKRIATAIEWLSEGKRRHWKYENC